MNGIPRVVCPARAQRHSAPGLPTSLFALGISLAQGSGVANGPEGGLKGVVGDGERFIEPRAFIERLVIQGSLT